LLLFHDSSLLLNTQGNPKSLKDTAAQESKGVQFLCLFDRDPKTPLSENLKATNYYSSSSSSSLGSGKLYSKKAQAVRQAQYPLLMRSKFRVQLEETSLRFLPTEVDSFSGVHHS
jgi:hypothetical protein